MTIATVARNFSPLITALLTFNTNVLTKLMAKLLCAGKGVPFLLTKVLAVATACSIGLHVVNGSGVSLLNRGALFSKSFVASLPRCFSDIILNVVMVIVVALLLVFFLSASCNRSFVTANSGPMVTGSLKVRASTAVGINLVVSGKLIKLYNTLITRDGNCTSIGVKVKAVMVTLTSVVVNRITFNRLALSRQLITMALKDVVCHLVLLTILRLKFDTGSLGLVSSVILTLYVVLPRLSGLFRVHGPFFGKIRAGS